MYSTDINRSQVQVFKENKQIQVRSFQLPIQRFLDMKKTQIKILNKLAESTKCQHSSFQTKYNVFKQMMANFIEINNELEHVIFETYEKSLQKQKQITKTNKKRNPEMAKRAQTNQMRLDTKVNLNQLKMKKYVDKNQEEQKSGKRAYIRKSRRQQNASANKFPKNQTKIGKQQESGADNSLMEQIESDQGQAYNQRHQKKRRRSDRSSTNWEQDDNKSVKSTTSVTSNFINHRKLSVEQKVQWIEGIISQKRTAPNFYGSFAQLLTLPYSVLQRLIEYNESSDYGINK